MIWSNIWRNQERKNAEIENFFGTLYLASWGLGNCDSDIAVSSIHHGSQYRLNFSDGFWVGGLEVCELCLTRILWISITQFGNRKRAWTRRWVCRPPLPPTSPTSSEIMLLMDRLLPPPVTGKAMNHNGLQWCLTAGGSAFSNLEFAQPRVWQRSGVLDYTVPESGAPARAAAEEGCRGGG